MKRSVRLTTNPLCKISMAVENSRHASKGSRTATTMATVIATRYAGLTPILHGCMVACADPGLELRRDSGCAASRVLPEDFFFAFFTPAALCRAPATKSAGSQPVNNRSQIFHTAPNLTPWENKVKIQGKINISAVRAPPPPRIGPSALRKCATSGAADTCAMYQA